MWCWVHNDVTDSLIIDKVPWNLVLLLQTWNGNLRKHAGKIPSVAGGILPGHEMERDSERQTNKTLMSWK